MSFPFRYEYFKKQGENYGQYGSKKEEKTMDTLALILAIIGSVNWGLVGIFRFDLVAWIFGGQAAVISRIIYTLVGLAGLWCITLLFRRNKAIDEP